MYEGDDPATTRTGAFRARGRHRRPRPRKVVLAAGGLAFAAGVLGLLRVVPDGGAGTGTGVGAGEASREGYAGGVTDLATNAAAAVPAPSGGPGDTHSTGDRYGTGDTRSTPGGAASRVPDPRSTPGTSGVPRPSAPSQELPVSPTPTPDTPAHAASPAPTPTPTVVPPESHTPSTTPTPDHPHDSPHGICIPVIGLCVDTPFNEPTP
ncbi:hypothetical protein ACSCBZ_02510 [Streptomyces niveiscabiei]|uniref:hypothetical protein n=1 Tax=Streptomyces niveiscabiei TaxID=164115 RepID=UPI003EBF9348